MTDLLELANKPTEIGQDKNIPKIHSLNVLRALYRDSRIAENIQSYVASGLAIALAGFSDPVWAVRNSCTLLFSSLVVRVFGVQRNKETLSKKNCLTGNVFFKRYPGLFDVLHDGLQTCTEHVESRLHAGLYPLLLVLGRLYPSSLEMTESSSRLLPFVTLVRKCGASPVLQMRLMSARALAPLVPMSEVISQVKEMVWSIPKQAMVSPTNTVHGTLLQLTELFTFAFAPDRCTKSFALKFYDEVVDLLSERRWISTSENPCFVTRQAWMKMMTQIQKCIHISKQPKIVGLNIGCVKAILDCLAQKPQQKPGWNQYMIDAVHWLLLEERSDCVNSYELLELALKSPVYEVRQISLEFLIKQGCYVIDEHRTSVLNILMFDSNEDCIRLSAQALMKLQNDKNPAVDDTTLKKAWEVTTNRMRDVKRDETLSSLTELLLHSAKALLSSCIDPIRKEEILRVCLESIEDGSSCCASINMRMAVAKAMNYGHSSFLEIPDSSSSKEIREVRFRMLRIALRLLMDDEVEVRNTMADGTSMGCCPEAAVRQFVDKVVRQSLEGNLLFDVFSWLKQLILEPLDCDPVDFEASTGAGHVFDKGELNLYRDDRNFLLKLMQPLAEVSGLISSLNDTELYQKLVTERSKAIGSLRNVASKLRIAGVSSVFVNSNSHCVQSVALLRQAVFISGTSAFGSSDELSEVIKELRDRDTCSNFKLELRLLLETKELTENFTHIMISNG